MPGSGSQATLQGPGSLPTVNLREEALAGSGVRQAAQCFCECPRCAGDTAQWKKTHKKCRLAGQDYTLCSRGCLFGSRGSFTLPTHAFYFRSFHHHFENSQISTPPHSRGEPVQMTSDPGREAGLLLVLGRGLDRAAGRGW